MLVVSRNSSEAAKATERSEGDGTRPSAARAARASAARAVPTEGRQGRGTEAGMPSAARRGSRAKRGGWLLGRWVGGQVPDRREGMADRREVGNVFGGRGSGEVPCLLPSRLNTAPRLCFCAAG